MSREKLLEVAKQINWNLVWREFSAPGADIKISRKTKNSLLPNVGYSILLMTDQRNRIFYAIKDYAGEKPNKKYVGKGSFATVKDALLVNTNGQPVLNYNVVVRSACDSFDSPFPEFVAKENLDSAIARAERFKNVKNVSVRRRYTIQKKATSNLKEYLVILKALPCLRDEEVVLDLAIRVAKLVYALHQKHKVAHRDIKPDNIVVVFNEKAEKPVVTDMWLIDFDFAQRNPKDKANRFIGSPHYVPCISSKAELATITHENFDIFALCRLFWLPENYKHFIGCNLRTGEYRYKASARNEGSSATLQYIFSDSFLESRPALKNILDTAHGFVNPDHSAAFILCALILEKEFSNFYNKKSDLYSAEAVKLQARNLTDSARPQSTEAVRVSQIPYALMPHNQNRRPCPSRKKEQSCFDTIECTML